ncbi:MAG: tetratricopeptide repeat protein [Gemmataceae bacterium]
MPFNRDLPQPPDARSMLSWDQTEYILKGLYLGLLLLIALLSPTWMDVGIVGACMAGGLALCLLVAAFQKYREGYRPRGKIFSYILFLLLENPGLVYTGILVGLAGGAYATFAGYFAPAGQRERLEEEWILLAPVLGGLALGVFFSYLHAVRDRERRNWSGLLLVFALSLGALLLLRNYGELLDQHGIKRVMIGAILLLGIPGFYLLTFSSLVEESEVEMAGICSAMGVGLAFLGSEFAPTFGTIAVVLPMAIYFLYTRRILPGLKVFKHALRGMSYARVGRYRQALASFNRALQLDPNHQLAYAQLWHLHRQVDFDKIRNDPETLALVNYDLCLDRVASLLLADKPTPEMLQEAHKLLDLVSSQRPSLEPRCAYWRTVALLHEKQYDVAQRQLEAVLVPQADNPQRRAILLEAWQLGLMLHPEMKRRVGQPQLALPGRRMEAIAAVERRLRVKPDEQPAWELKRILYPPLTVEDFDQAAQQNMGDDFDYGYAEQIGVALVADAKDWRRGCDFLRIAARGRPAKAPLLYIQIAKAHEKYNDEEGLWDNYLAALRIAKKVGVSNLSAEDKVSLFAVAKLLGDHATKANRLDVALEAYKFYSTYEKAGAETWRTLAELFERKAAEADAHGRADDYQNNLWLALNCTEHALSYSGFSADRDLLERKDRYMVSITPEEVKKRWENVRLWFDVDYCLNKTKQVLERYNGELENLDWAAHLLSLARHPGRSRSR